jgi:methionyl-tRNA formyltransferase
MTKKIQIGILASGGLGHTTLQELDRIIEPVFVFTDKASIEIQKFCLARSIPVFIGNPRGGKSKEFLKEKDVDVLFSINYLFLVEQDLLKKAKLYSINFHGSLLPKYRGRTPHVWAIINDEKKVGITAHLMVEECDAGDIILQKEIDVNSEDTGQDILRKYVDLYPKMILEIVHNINCSNLVVSSQNNRYASYFGKRTPDDGKIDWNWQKERIKNWVRAQSYPYPGAFAFYNNEKIIIDKVRFIDEGYHFNTVNGEIIETNPEVLVKTPNGVIALEEIRNKCAKNFKLGEKLS